MNNADIQRLILTIFKSSFVIGSLLYIVFAIVVIRQIVVMKRTLITSFNPVILFLGYVHLGLAVAVFLFYLTFL
ncbi:MAG: hypothetical protein GF381_02580 [Candidatus Pacebacteria bacterium]|nr:hypothetical protein [Candidatus Paceibacterota bacterium]